MNFKQVIKKITPKKFLSLWHLFWAWYGAFKYKHPSEELLVIGVTGTTGKSSTIFLLRQILEKAGFVVGSFSTIDFCIAGKCELNDRKMTMLGRMEIQKYLREMVNKKCNVAIVETTSEGRLQHRHRFINYDMMVFTNLYPEHIESHGSFEAYKQAKLDLFEYVSKLSRKKDKKIGKTAIVNGNSQYAEEFLQFDFDKKITFGKDISDVEIKKDGLYFFIADKKFHAPLYGKHNVENISTAFAVARELGAGWNSLQKTTENFKPIPGRIEFISEAEKFGFKAIVDYAFEPEALKALYKVVELINPEGKIIHVCGSTGGGRDKARREPIGKFVGKKSDIFIVTDEDPYDEDPMKIMKTVSAGAQEVGKVLDKALFEILDRKEAIHKAVDMAEEGDLILVTGKGSEQKMCLAGEKMIEWDDREIIREALKNKK